MLHGEKREQYLSHMSQSTKETKIDPKKGKSILFFLKDEESNPDVGPSINYHSPFLCKLVY